MRNRSSFVLTAVVICVKAANGGLFVAFFAALGEMLQPKRFAGIFGASPAVALANLIVIALARGETSARDSAVGMIAGAIALVVACAAGVPAVRRWGAERAAALLWAVWILAAAAVAVPAAVAASAASGAGLPPGRPAGRRTGRRTYRRADRGPKAGPADMPLFGVDVKALREIRPRALALRFAFGAGVSVVAGLVGVVAGQRAGGVMLAPPAALSATLTIIEREEGRRPAVTEVQGAVIGALALVGFAVVAAVSLARMSVPASLLAALAAWVVIGFGGYLIQSAAMPAWQHEVRALARQRTAAALARRR